MTLIINDITKLSIQSVKTLRNDQVTVEALTPRKNVCQRKTLHRYNNRAVLKISKTLITSLKQKDPHPYWPTLCFEDSAIMEAF